ncbi:MAG TPA: hypothetical protein VF780_05225, partial [Nitrosospira sp.]
MADLDKVQNLAALGEVDNARRIPTPAVPEIWPWLVPKPGGEKQNSGPNITPEKELAVARVRLLKPFKSNLVPGVGIA